MKKYLFLLAVLYLIPVVAPAQSAVFNEAGRFILAKTVKLGRGQAYSMGNLNNVDTGSEIETTSPCDPGCAEGFCTNGTCSKCTGDKYLVNNTCQVCPENYSYNSPLMGCVKDTMMCYTGCAPGGCGIGSTTTPEPGHYLTAGGQCPACSNAVANCSTCTQTSLKSPPSCTTCQSGYRLVNGACVANCTNVTCSEGYSATSTNEGCCCNKSSCPANCTTCSTSSSCTKCSTGFLLSGSSCASCPANATCTGTNTFTCNTGYYKNGSTCSSCPAGCSSCSSSTVCTACSDNYTLEGNSCVSDCNYWDISYSSCSKGYRRPKSGGTCTKCPANTECGTCPRGCAGSTAGTCSSAGYTCLRCALNVTDPTCNTCPSGYILTIDGTTCASASGTGYDMRPTCY